MYKNAPTKNVSKSYGGSKSSSFTMKNSMLRKGSMHKTPMQMNYGPMKKPGLIDTVKNVSNKALNAGSKLVNYIDDVTSKTDSAKNFNTKRKTNYGEKESGAKKASSLKGTTPGHFTMPEKIQV